MKKNNYKKNQSWGKDTGFYRKKTWRNLRELKINQNPICELHEKIGETEPTYIIDHILNRLLFPEYELEIYNLQGLCFRCHQQKGNLEKLYNTDRISYLKALDAGRLQYICTKEAKQKLFELIENKKGTN